MSSLTFKLKQSLSSTINLSALTPDNLISKTIEQIVDIDLFAGKEKIKVIDLFDIEGDDNENIIIQGDLRLAQYLGKEMTMGRLTIEGNVGDYLGMSLKGGELRLKGNAGNFALSGMIDGTVHIEGDVGSFLGAPIPGNSFGIAGGFVAIDGNAGDRAGDKMRRGIMLIKGNVGEYCASQMIAGTIAIAGKVERNLGFSMQRGTIVLKEMPPLLATFNDCGTHNLPFLGLLQNYLASTDVNVSEFINPGIRARRFVGDRGNGGLGEILVY